MWHKRCARNFGHSPKTCGDAFTRFSCCVLRTCCRLLHSLLPTASSAPVCGATLPQATRTRHEMLDRSRRNARWALHPPFTLISALTQSLPPNPNLLLSFYLLSSSSSSVIITLYCYFPHLPCLMFVSYVLQMIFSILTHPFTSSLFPLLPFPLSRVYPFCLFYTHCLDGSNPWHLCDPQGPRGPVLMIDNRHNILSLYTAKSEIVFLYCWPAIIE